MKNTNRNHTIEEFIKKNYELVEDKPGYVWLSKRNFQIISIETYAKCLEEYWQNCGIKMQVESEDKG